MLSGVRDDRSQQLLGDAGPARSGADEEARNEPYIGIFVGIALSHELRASRTRVARPRSHRAPAHSFAILVSQQAAWRTSFRREHLEPPAIRITPAGLHIADWEQKPHAPAAARGCVAAEEVSGVVRSSR